MSIADDIRSKAFEMEKATHNMTSDWTTEFLRLAARVELLENNFAYLGSCMAATAEGLAARKQSGVGEIVRQAALMDALGRALAGFSVERYPVSTATAIARVEAAKNLLAERSKTKR